MKRLIIGILLILLVLAGCSEPMQPVTSALPADWSPPEEEMWISPGKVEIGNFYPGATAEWEITIHNGDSVVDEIKSITTEKNETEADIPVNHEPAGLDGIVILSSIDETLTAVSTGKSSIKIKGFTPDINRTVKITYPYMAEYQLTTRIPTDGVNIAGYESWIEIENPAPVLKPMESIKVLVSLKIPKNTELPDDLEKWEFWVVAAEKGSTSLIQTELASRWLVEMR
jgi:hypothetical protein